MVKPLRALITAVVFLFLSAVYADKESSEPIVLLENDWTSQLVLARVTGAIFKEMGYDVQYMTLNTEQQWGALARGIAHVQIEVWEGTMSKMFNRMLASGKIIDAGSHSALTREDWWYPSYIEKDCPGLPDWRALRSCAELFSNAATAPRGRYLAGPWEKPEAARIRALDLGFKADAVTHADDLWLELAQAAKTKTPIVLFNWTPNWVEARYEGKFIEFPEYHPACEVDPEWGVNPEYHHDCGNPKNGWLKKAAWSYMGDKWPCALAALKNINFDNKTISMLAARVDVDKWSHQESADEWISNHRDVWRSWLPEHCRNPG